MAIQAVIFDLDGTLVDTTTQHADSWQQAFEQFGYEVEFDRIEDQIGKGGDLLVPSLLGEEAEQEHGDLLRDRHSEIFREIIEEEKVTVLPGVPNVFEVLQKRGLRTAIATAATQENLDHTLEQLDFDLLSYPDVVINDSDVETSKPRPGSVLPAVRKLGLKPANCLMIGDTEYDVIACKKAGIPCIGVTTGPHDADRLRKSGAVAVYRNLQAFLADLPDALEKLES